MTILIEPIIQTDSASRLAEWMKTWHTYVPWDTIMIIYIIVGIALLIISGAIYWKYGGANMSRLAMLGGLVYGVLSGVAVALSTFQYWWLTLGIPDPVLIWAEYVTAVPLLIGLSIIIAMLIEHILFENYREGSNI